MKTLEIIAGILVGGLVITWILYLVVRCLGNCRDYKDELDREEDDCYRYKMPKKTD